MSEYVPLGFGSHVRKPPEPEPPAPEKEEMPEEITSLPEGTVVLTVTFTREDRDGLNGLNVDWDPGKDDQGVPYIDPMLSLRLVAEAAEAFERVINPAAMIMKWLRGKA